MKAAGEGLSQKLWGVYNWKKLREGIKQLSLSGRSSAIIADTFLVSADKINDLAGFLQVNMKKLFESQGVKVYDASGNRVALQKVDYTAEIEEVVRDHLRYVNRLSDAQRKTAIQIISKGLDEGKSTSRVAKEAMEQIQGLTRRRANMIARTEITKASATAQLKTMRSNGIDRYVWIAALDDRTCNICRGYHKQVFEVGRGPLPVRESHVNCRCVIAKA